MTIKEVEDQELREMAELVRDMNKYVLEKVQDENAVVNRWFAIVPDQADEDDFIYIADESELFHAALRVFAELATESV